MVIGFLCGVRLIPAVGVTEIGDLFFTLVVVGHGDNDDLFVGGGDSSMRMTSCLLIHAFMSMHHATPIARSIPTNNTPTAAAERHTTHVMMTFCCSYSSLGFISKMSATHAMDCKQGAQFVQRTIQCKQGTSLRFEPLMS